MTTKADWEFRAEYLRCAANRLEKQSEDLKREAVGLRDIAKACDSQAKGGGGSDA